MGQTLSKVTQRVVGSSTSATNSVSKVPTGGQPPPKHIPSIPGKSSADVIAAGGGVQYDPITGFTRGTAPLTPSEERQRQFLVNRQYDMIKIQQEQQIQRTQQQQQGSRGNTSTSDVVSSQQPLPPMGTDTKMPDDLLKFINDMGPVIRDKTNTTNSKDQQPLNRRVPRVARLLPQQQQQSSFNFVDPSSHDTSIIPSHEDNELSTTNAAQQNQNKPGYDKTRIVTQMPLASQIPGYETSRTTSFSTKMDVISHDEDDKVHLGYNMIEFYGLLSEYSKQQPPPRSTITEMSNKNDTINTDSSSSHPATGTLSSILASPQKPTNTAVVTSPTINDHEQLLQHVYQYVQIPILLKDSSVDGSSQYIGVHPSQVTSLLNANRKTQLLNTNTQAKLILQELYENNNESLAITATAVPTTPALLDTTTNTTTTTGAATVMEQSTTTTTVSSAHFDLGPSKAAAAAAAANAAK